MFAGKGCKPKMMAINSSAFHPRRLSGSLRNVGRRFARSAVLLRHNLFQADRIPTATLPQERDTLFRLAMQKRGGVAIELGSALGASSCFIAAGLRERDAKLYCVDRWNVEYRRENGEDRNYIYHDDGTVSRYLWDDALGKIRYAETYEAAQDCPTYAQFLRNVEMFSDVIVPLREDSAAAAMRFVSSVDLLFIDAGHLYEEVRRDWNAWQSKLAPGAIVIFHDSGWAPGIKRVIDEEVMPRMTWHASLPNMFWGAV